MHKQVLTVQLGGLANFAGTHFWNLQEEAVRSFEPEDDEDQIDDWYKFSTYYYETKGRGRSVAFRPRLLLVDERRQFGAFTTFQDDEGEADVVREVEELFNSRPAVYREDRVPMTSVAAGLGWGQEGEEEDMGFGMDFGRNLSFAPRKVGLDLYEEDLEEDDGEYEEEEIEEGHDEGEGEKKKEESKPRVNTSTELKKAHDQIRQFYFTDLTQANYDVRSVVPVVSSANWNDWGAAFSFRDSILCNPTAVREQLEDALHVQLEACDSLDAVQLLLDPRSPVSSLQNVMMQMLMEEVPKAMFVSSFMHSDLMNRVSTGAGFLDHLMPAVNDSENVNGESEAALRQRREQFDTVHAAMLLAENLSQEASFAAHLPLDVRAAQLLSGRNALQHYAETIQYQKGGVKRVNFAYNVLAGRLGATMDLLTAPARRAGNSFSSLHETFTPLVQETESLLNVAWCGGLPDVAQRKKDAMQAPHPLAAALTGSDVKNDDSNNKSSKMLSTKYKSCLNEPLADNIPNSAYDVDETVFFEHLDPRVAKRFNNVFDDNESDTDSDSESEQKSKKEHHRKIDYRRPPQTEKGFISARANGFDLFSKFSTLVANAPRVQGVYILPKAYSLPTGLHAHALSSFKPLMHQSVHTNPLEYHSAAVQVFNAKWNGGSAAAADWSEVFSSTRTGKDFKQLADRLNFEQEEQMQLWETINNHDLRGLDNDDFDDEYDEDVNYAF